VNSALRSFSSSLAVGRADVLLGPLDECQDVAHAEDAAGEPIRVEHLERFGLLAGPEELHADAGDGCDREGRPTPSIAIDLGEDQPGHGDRGLEGLGDRNGLLAGHRVHHEERLDGMDGRVDVADLAHQHLVDAEAARGVEDDRVPGQSLRGIERAADDGDDRGAFRAAVDRYVDRLAERLELLCRRRPVRVRGDKQRSPADAHHVPGELGRGRRLARSLEPDEGDDRGVAGQVEVLLACGEEADELIVDDLHDLLAGRQAREDLRADGSLANPGDEVLHDAELDVGLEQGQPDLAHRHVDVRLGHAPPAREGGERAAQAIAELIEHGGWSPLQMDPRRAGDGERRRGGYTGSGVPAGAV
jgi:hypothetical protein